MVAQPKVTHLALADKLLHATHEFFNGSEAIPEVAPQEVDVVGSQAAQGVFHRVHHALTTTTTTVWVPWPHVSTKLRGNDNLITGASPRTRAEVVADHLFTVPLGVNIGGVDEVSAQFKVATDHGVAVGHIGSKPPFCSKCHGPQTDWVNAQAAATKSDIVGGIGGHGSTIGVYFPMLQVCG